MKCAACGIQTTRRLCNFCRRTVQLVRERRCVSCTARIVDDGINQQGKCGECLSRNNPLSAGTRKVLYYAAKARYHERRLAA